MANTGFKGIDILQSGNELVFLASLKDSTGAKLTTGTTNLTLYEVQSDGTLKSYDFNDNTFKTTALTTPALAMTHRTGNNGATNTGVWTVALATLTGFTVNAKYIAQINNTGASPPDQEQKFQYGGGDGDLSVSAGGKAAATIATGDFADILATRAAKIDNLDATVTSRSTPATAQTIDQTTAIPASPTAGTIGEALKRADLISTNSADSPNAGAAFADVASMVVSGVNLAASQPNYAPSKAGAQMDLVNAPNATAITAIQNGLSKPGTAQTITLPAITAGWLTATGIAAGALNGKGDWSTYAGTDTSGTTTLLTRIPGIVQPQTGDSYLRLGAPTGASIAADIQTRSTLTQAQVTGGAYALNTDGSGRMNLASTGLDQISAVAPSALATTFVGKVMQVHQRFFGKNVLDTNANTLSTYAPDNSTVATTQTATNTGGVQTVGHA